MNKRLTSRLTLLMIFVLISTISALSQLIGGSYYQSKQNGEGKVVFVYNEVFGFTEKKGDKVEGILVDLMSAFEEYVWANQGIKLNHEFVYLENDFSGFMNTVKQARGGVFGLGNFTSSVLLT